MSELNFFKHERIIMLVLEQRLISLRPQFRKNAKCYREKDNLVYIKILNKGHQHFYFFDILKPSL